MMSLMLIIFALSLMGIVCSMPIEEKGFKYGNPVLFGVFLVPFLGSAGYLGWELFKMLVKAAI